jgi:hypothetical protein
MMRKFFKQSNILGMQVSHAKPLAPPVKIIELRRKWKAMYEFPLINLRLWSIICIKTCINVTFSAQLISA